MSIDADVSGALRFRGAAVFFGTGVFLGAVALFFDFDIPFTLSEGSRLTSTTVALPIGAAFLIAPFVSAFSYKASGRSITGAFSLAALRAERRKDMIVVLRGVCLRSAMN